MCFSNASLPSLGGFPALQSIGGRFKVYNNVTLTSLGDFSVLQSIGGRFGVERNNALTSLGDFPALQSIGGRFGVERNNALTSLGDFPALQSIRGIFYVWGNIALISLGGFPMLASIGSSDGIYVPSTRTDEDNVSIMVRENDQLQDCCVLTAFLRGATNAAVSGKVIINDNALGCNSTTEVNCDPFLQVSQKVIFVAKTATEGTLEIFSTLRWQLSKPNTEAEWITNIAAGGGNSDASSITGENNAFITITTTANPNDAGRSTTLTLRAIDQTGNVLTDPTPVTIPFTQLGTTHTGDVSVTTQAEVDALRTSLTAGASRIVGNVTIGPESGTSDISDLSPLAAITQITGSLSVQHNPDLPNLMGLNQLQSIGGSFRVGGYDAGNASLTSLGDFTALQTIGGGFEMSRNRSLTSLGNFPALQSIGGGFDVGGNASLTSLGDFPTLQSIGGGFVVEDNYALISLGDFPALQSIGYSFVVEDNYALISLGDFPALQSIGGWFSVEGNRSLTSLGDFSVLQSIGGRFGVERNAALISLGGFPMLASIGSDQDGVSIKVKWNKRLQDCCVLTAFLRGATNAAVSGKVFINDNALGCNSTTEVNCDPFLQVSQKVIFVAKTATEGTLEIFSTLRWQLSKPNTGTEWITNIAAGGGNSDASSITGENDAFITITTTANPNDAGRSTTLTLRAIDQTGNVLTDPTPVTIPFTQLGTTHTGDVSVTTQAEVDALRTSLTAGASRIVGNVTIGPASGTSDISDLSPLAAITQITGSLSVQHNPDLPNLMGLNQLQSIGGSFEMPWNRSLTSLGDFSALQTIGGGFEMSRNRSLTSLGNFPALQSIGGGFDVGGNDALTSLGDFPALQTIGGGFYASSDALTSLGDFPALQTIGDSFQVRINTFLTSLGDFPALQSIGGGFEVYYNDALTSLGDFPALQSIGDSFEVSSNADLTSLGDFPALQTIGGRFEVRSNIALISLGDFPALQTIGDGFLVKGNRVLTSLGGFPMLASISSSNGVYVPSTGTDEDNVSILVEGNYRLQDCCVLTSFLRDATNAVSGQVFINDNAPGCNSTTQVNCNSFLQVGQKVVFATKIATESTLEIFSRLRWQLSKPNTGAEWITNIAAGGGNSDASSITGENDTFIAITTTTNPNDAGRSTTLTLTAMDMAGNALTDPTPITILFTQLGTTHTGDVFVRTQAEVDALRTSLTADATHIMGNVTIGSESGTSDITDLSPLTTITEITGDVLVQRNPDLPNLIGLNQLQSIGGSFKVDRNNALTSLGTFPPYNPSVVVLE